MNKEERIVKFMQEHPDIAELLGLSVITEKHSDRSKKSFAKIVSKRLLKKEQKQIER